MARLGYNFSNEFKIILCSDIIQATCSPFSSLFHALYVTDGRGAVTSNG